MNKWRIFSVAAAAAMLLTGCAKIEQDTMPELIAATETTPLVPVATAAEQRQRPNCDFHHIQRCQQCHPQRGPDTGCGRRAGQD